MLVFTPICLFTELENKTERCRAVWLEAFSKRSKVITRTIQLHDLVLGNRAHLAETCTANRE